MNTPDFDSSRAVLESQVLEVMSKIENGESPTREEAQQALRIQAKFLGTDPELPLKEIVQNLSQRGLIDDVLSLLPYVDLGR